MTKATSGAFEAKDLRDSCIDGRERVTVSWIRIPGYAPWGKSCLLTGGRKMECMFEDWRVSRYDFEDSGGDPSEGMMQVMWKLGWCETSLLVNSIIGTRWLKPGLETTAM